MKASQHPLPTSAGGVGAGCCGQFTDICGYFRYQPAMRLGSSASSEKSAGLHHATINAIIHPV